MSWASHRSSKAFFLTGSINMVSRAVLFSIDDQFWSGIDVNEIIMPGCLYVTSYHLDLPK
jgi:hypothetical protein